MDGDRFDAMTRALATGGSRRAFVRTMTAGIGAGIAAFAGAVGIDAAPRCKRVNQACQTTADCCPGPNANGNVYCAPNGRKSKTCQACPAEAPIACNGGCVDTSDDNNNCGACGERCLGGQTCANGICQCPPNEVLGSNNACVCPAGYHVCADGSCQECCTHDDCEAINDETCCSGTCTTTFSDEQNCGSCGVVCGVDQFCDTGDCACDDVGKVVGPEGTCVCAAVSCNSVTGPSDFFCCPGWRCGEAGVCVVAGASGAPCGAEFECDSDVCSGGFCA